MLGNAKASDRGTTTVEFHVFFVPYSEGFGCFLRWILSLFLGKIGHFFSQIWRVSLIGVGLIR